MSNRTFMAQKNLFLIASGLGLLGMILLVIGGSEKSNLCIVLGLLIILIPFITALSRICKYGTGGMITFSDKFIKAPQGIDKSVMLLYSEFKIVYLDKTKNILLKKQNGKIVGKLIVRAFNYSEIKEILKELQKHGKIIEIDPALQGVFDFDPQQPKKHSRHLEV